jgi:signal transduction histidine kinase
MVAHGLTLMVIQAGAARWLGESDPVKAREALRAVEAAGGQALNELDTLVGSLDPVDRDREEALPANAHLEVRTLVEEAAAAGMGVELVCRGDPRPLAAGLEVSLYRIVQEALTNVTKHAPGAIARVELRYVPEGIEIEVTDQGGHPDANQSPIPGAGQGLIGISERAALFGGRSECGQTPDGGFRVWASLSEERLPV